MPSATVSSRLVRMWPAIVAAHEPLGDARSATAARVADLAAAAEERAGAARLRTYPLPRRTTLAQMRKAMAARLRAARVTALAGCNADVHLCGILKEVAGLQVSCLTLMEAAHSAGLAWLSAGQGPGLAAAQAWCKEFVEVSASVHGAHVQAQATVMPPCMEATRHTDGLQGGRRASSPLYLLC